MKLALLAACALSALALPTPVSAQHSRHGPAAPQPAEPPQGHSRHPAPAPQQPAQPAQEDHSRHGAPGAPVTDAHQGHDPTVSSDPAPLVSSSGALGRYPMTREASGTGWQPDSSQHGGLHRNAGSWDLMGHALLNAVYDWQQGGRGDETGFVSGMAMASARRNFRSGHIVQLRAMLSPDPLMGARGYPLHLAAGETADGEHVLVDRQHPHDLFMELSASYSVPLGRRATFFVYGGLPGAPAFGPPAFMHRMSAMDSPEAPISHHWLDSTHIVFGVATAGLVLGDVMIEASRFNGREPDQNRWDIETGPLDSTAARISANPTRNLSLQASWTRLISPEQVEPGENETRWSASAIWTRRFGARSWWSTTFAWGRRSSGHDEMDAFTLESAAGLGAWTLFGRAETVETDELLAVGGHHGPVFDVAKVSFGAIRDFRVAEHVRLGLGGLYALNFVPRGLEPSYGGDPDGAMLFLRLRID